MALKLYNTLTRKKEAFKPLCPPQVSLYTCGPTVYNYAHIGNLRSYIFEDTLKRTLLFNNYKVKHVMNITDVGHLTSDADTGLDKMLKAAQREKKTVWDIAQFYTQAFQRDIQALNILEPDIWCQATAHIKEQIKLIQKLEKKGFTYQAGGNVYFDTSKLKDYGKLAHLDLKKEGSARVEKDPHKKNPHDFVLWFTRSKFTEQEMKWPSPFGLGYPGWHLECSAMSMKYLGEQFDLHCGGIDHIPVHHTNEIAQSEAATGKKPWVRYWLHNEFLVLASGEKMAKSGENFITLTTLKEKGFSPLDYRYFCLGTHYRKPLMFSYEALEGAKNTFQKLKERFLEPRKTLSFCAGELCSPCIKKAPAQLNKTQLNKKYLTQFTQEINDDLNTPQALATLWAVLKDETLTPQESSSLLLKFDEVLGLGLKALQEEKIPSEILALARQREQARKAQDWSKADSLRQQLQKLGYSIEDREEGPKIKKI